MLWEIKDILQRNMTNAQMHKLLLVNNQETKNENDRKEVIILSWLNHNYCLIWDNVLVDTLFKRYFMLRSIKKVRDLQNRTILISVRLTSVFSTLKINLSSIIISLFHYQCRNCKNETKNPERDQTVLNSKCYCLSKYQFKVEQRILQNKVEILVQVQSNFYS